MRTVTAIILAALVASACATAGDVLERSTGEEKLERYQPYIGEPVDRFTAFRYDSWQPVGKNQLVVQTTFNDAYLLTLMGTCPDLEFANTVRLTSTGSTVSTFDKVIVRGMRCPIQRIQPIDLEQMRADRAASNS